MSISKSRWVRALPLTVLLLTSTALAESGRRLDASTYDTLVKASAGHPNELARWHGMWSYGNGRMGEALVHFRLAARFGDKFSQHFLSLMYWHGEGVEKDPVQAYIWADLAAERGNVKDLLEIREKLWPELSAGQQRQVQEQGLSYYAEYGDAVAVPRANSRIRRFADDRTGSRAGADTSGLWISLGGPNNGRWGGPGAHAAMAGRMDVTERTMYGTDRTNPRVYWKFEDAMLGALLGSVKIGPLERVDDKPPTEGK